MDHDKLRLECLRIAATLDVPPERVLEIAAQLFDYVTGRSLRATA
jgi:hypothetical protein